MKKVNVWSEMNNEEIFKNEDSSATNINNFTSRCFEEKEITDILYENFEVQEAVAELILKLEDSLAKLIMEKEECSSELENIPLPDEVVYQKRTFFTNPYFVDINGFHAPQNEDAKMKKVTHHFDAYCKMPRIWGDVEYKTLFQGIKQHAIDIFIKPLTIKLRFLREKMKTSHFSRKQKITRQISFLQRKIEEKKNLAVEKIIKESEKKIDWLYVSSFCMKGSRSPRECELAFRHFLSPDINNKEFTAEEDKNLKEIAEKNNERNWDDIAKKLNTNRTAIQCLERYQRHINDKLKNCNFDKDLNKKIIQAVKAYRIGNVIPWDKVAYEVSGPVTSQIREYWDHVLNPQNKVSESWTTEEDAVLCLGVSVMGYQWKNISHLLHGRASYKCRVRYIQFLNPALVKKWTYEEDILLLKLIAKYGKKWGTINDHFSGKTNEMIRKRAAVLERRHSALYKELIDSKGLTSVEYLLSKHELTESSRQRITQNWKSENLQKKAFTCALAAAIKVCGHQINILECQDFSDLSSNITKNSLREIAAMLLSKFDETSYSNPCCADFSTPINYDTDECTFKRFSSVTFEENYKSVEDVENDLNVLLMPQALVNDSCAGNIHNITFKSSPNFDAVSSYFHKLFMIENLTKDVKGITDVTVNEKMNSFQTVSRVLDCFVMAQVSAGILPLLPPNIHSIGAAMLLCENYRRVKPLVEKVSNKSMNMWNVIYNSKNQESAFLCPKCQNTSKVQGGCDKLNKDDSQEICLCHKLNKYRKQWMLLKYRVTSVFFWPCILSTLRPSFKQLTNCIKKKSCNNACL